MGKGYRAGRMGEEIRKIISELLLREIKDPRITGNMVSVSAVDVSGDGSYATVYLSVLGFGSSGFASDEQKAEVLEGFEKAKGMIRREVGHALKVHHVPELTFKIDNSMEYGCHMNEVINSLGITHDSDEVTEEAAAEAELDDILKDL